MSLTLCIVPLSSFSMQVHTRKTASELCSASPLPCSDGAVQQSYTVKFLFHRYGFVWGKETALECSESLVPGSFCSVTSCWQSRNSCESWCVRADVYSGETDWKICCHSTAEATSAQEHTAQPGVTWLGEQPRLRSLSHKSSAATSLYISRNKSVSSIKALFTDFYLIF